MSPKVPKAHIWVAGCLPGQPDLAAQNTSGLRPLDFSHPYVLLFSTGGFNPAGRFWGVHFVMVHG